MASVEEPLLGSLLEMGFSRQKALKALSCTGNTSVENAMEWLISHPDDETEDFNLEAPAQVTMKLALTEEERAEQARKLEERRQQRRAEIAEQERKAEIEREKVRRLTGKEILDAKEKAQQAEMKKIAEERRRDKEDDRKAKQRIKDLIAEDRQRKLEENAKALSNAAHTPVPVSAPASFSSLPTYDPNIVQTRIQIRMIDGSALTQTFGVNEPLSAVRLYAQLHRKDGVSDQFGFMTNFPKRDFTEDEMQAPLSALGLIPSATLIATRRVPQAI